MSHGRVWNVTVVNTRRTDGHCCKGKPVIWLRPFSLKYCNLLRHSYRKKKYKQNQRVNHSHDSVFTKYFRVVELLEHFNLHLKIPKTNFTLKSFSN